MAVMGKTVRDAKLESPAAREKLKRRAKPYYKAIDKGLHLGYRRGKDGGRWVMRRYIGGEKYVVETIATADDHSSADGGTILNFHQAQAKARSLISSGAEGDLKASPFTVRQAVEDYLDWLKEHGKSAADARNRAENDIFPDLGKLEINSLTKKIIDGWQKRLANRPRHVRGKKGKPARELKAPETAEEIRRRKSTTNRTLTVLRAALNGAFREGHGIQSDAAWRTVKPYREVDTARLRYLDANEIKRLVNASSGDFRKLLNAAVLTGCRYGELAKLHVSDFNADAGTVYVQKSKSGKPRHLVLTAEGQHFFAQTVIGRDGEDLMLSNNGSEWGASRQLRPMKLACKSARILPPIGFHILRHTYASLLIMAGVPPMVVAKNLGHSDTRMVEKHYGHLAPSFVADTIRKLAPEFGIVEKTNIKQLQW
jgi:integrase